MSLGKLVGLVLGAACGVLALVGGLLLAGVGTGVSPAGGSDPSLERPLPAVGGGSAIEPPEETAYSVVAQRPLFNENRQPDIEEAEVVEAGDGEGDQGPVEPPPPLEVDVKGIIIAPEVKLAIVTDRKSNSTQRLREGMPLEGELAAWTLAEINPRSLVFDGEGADRAEIELVVNTKALAGAPPVTNRTARPGADESGDETADSGEEQAEQLDPEARAEEIRRRVAERRAQLREEAERRRATRENDEQ